MTLPKHFRRRACGGPFVANPTGDDFCTTIPPRPDVSGKARSIRERVALAVSFGHPPVAACILECEKAHF